MNNVNWATAKNLIIKYTGIAILYLLIVVLITLPVMWLWNIVMPELFNLPKIGFRMALAITFLTKLLFNNNK